MLSDVPEHTVKICTDRRQRAEKWLHQSALSTLISLSSKVGSPRGPAPCRPDRKFSCCCHTGRKWLPLRLFFNEDTDVSISFRFLSPEPQSTAMQPRRQVRPARCA